MNSITIFAPTIEDGDVAQLVEQRTENPCVGGSIPSITTEKGSHMVPFLFNHQITLKMNYSVYVLKSSLSEIHYVGMATDIQKRPAEHNAGKSSFTKSHRPWILLYAEYVGDTKKARAKEKYYKSTAGKNYLRKNGLI